MTCPLSGTNDQILAGYFALLTASLLPRSKRTFDTEQESKHPSHLPCCANDQILPSILHCRPILTPAEQMISFDTGKRRSILHAHTVTQACNFPLDIPHRRPCPHSLEANKPLAPARDTARRPAHGANRCSCLDIPHRRPCPHSLETNEPLALARDTTPAYLPATQKDAVARIFCIASHATLPRNKRASSTGKGYYPSVPARDAKECSCPDILHRQSCPYSLEANKPLALARDTTRRAHPWHKQICKVKPRQGPLPALNARTLEAFVRT